MRLQCRPGTLASEVLPMRLWCRPGTLASEALLMRLWCRPGTLTSGTLSMRRGAGTEGREAPGDKEMRPTRAGRQRIDPQSMGMRVAVDRVQQPKQ